MQLNSVIVGENAIKFWYDTDSHCVDVSFYAALRRVIKQGGWAWLEDVVAAESSVTVFFNLMLSDYKTVKCSVFGQTNDIQSSDINSALELITLPVHYGGEVGADIEEVARRCKLTVKEVIKLHQGSAFTVTAVGFSPGFGYLKGLNNALRLPRRDDPRLSVPRGAVAIAENYTAVYPESSPGGWHLIGYCPESLFDISLPVPALFKVGQQVKFIAVD